MSTVISDRYEVEGALPTEGEFDALDLSTGKQVLLRHMEAVDSWPAHPALIRQLGHLTHEGRTLAVEEPSSPLAGPGSPLPGEAVSRVFAAAAWLHARGRGVGPVSADSVRSASGRLKLRPNGEAQPARSDVEALVSVLKAAPATSAVVTRIGGTTGLDAATIAAKLRSAGPILSGPSGAPASRTSAPSSRPSPAPGRRGTTSTAPSAEPPPALPLAPSGAHEASSAPEPAVLLTDAAPQPPPSIPSDFAAAAGAPPIHLVQETPSAPEAAPPPAVRSPLDDGRPPYGEERSAGMRSRVLPLGSPVVLLALVVVILLARPWANPEPSTVTGQPPPPSADDEYARGFLALKNQDANTALRHLRRCVELDPQHANCWWELGWAHWQREDYRKVTEAWTEVRRLDPGREKLTRWLRKAELKAGTWLDTPSAAFDQQVARIRGGRLLDTSAVRGMDCEELWGLRNWVYARHGYDFGSSAAREWFDRQPAYRRIEGLGGEEAVRLFSELDRQNRDIVIEREAKRGCN